MAPSSFVIQQLRRQVGELYQVNILPPHGSLHKQRKIVEPLAQSLDTWQLKAVLKAGNKILEKSIPGSALDTTVRLFKAIALYASTDEKEPSQEILVNHVCKNHTPHGIGDPVTLQFLILLSPSLLSSEFSTRN